MRNFNIRRLLESVDMKKGHVSSELNRLVEKWGKTGLLRGLEGTKKENMARLLENQARQLIKETSEAGNDLRGFQNIAFPLVRRVFGGLVANELVSVQPMSLPVGLIFYLDFTYGTIRGVPAGIAAQPQPGGPFTVGDSIYGNPAGNEMQYGVSGSGGQYDLIGNPYSKVWVTTPTSLQKIASGCFGNDYAIGDATHIGDGVVSNRTWGEVDRSFTDSAFSASALPDTAGTYMWVVIRTNQLTGTIAGKTAASTMDLTDMESVWICTGSIASTIRRFTRVGVYDIAGGTGHRWYDYQLGQTAQRTHLLLLVSGVLFRDGSEASWLNAGQHLMSATFTVPDTLTDSFGDGSINLNPAWESDFNTTTNPIPEIDISVTSVSVTPFSRKLRARWTAELAQDLNAFHNLDAEVELTSILSEQIAQEIDNEILGDLLQLGTAANYFWSRIPGRFVHKTTGLPDNTGTFTGNIHEWYEGLVETVIDVANQILRKTLRGAGNFLVVGPDVATILENTVSYNMNLSTDAAGQIKYPSALGVTNMGSLRNRFTLYNTPYFPRNKILVGYKGNSFLETGYVYAPYVPLITTPVIYDPEEFTPRRGCMTRYGKKMVRADFYGSVSCLDLNII